MARTNDEVARALAELASLTELDEGSPNAFRVRAYQNAERAVRSLSEDVGERSESELAQVKGIGKSIAGRIRQFVETGRIDKLEELREKHPPEKLKLMKVPGLGAKSVQLLEDELGVRDIDALAAALDDGRVSGLPGMGAKTVENLKEGIAKLGLTSKDQRVPIATALPAAERIVAALDEVPAVEQVAYAGSLRRFRADIGDVDVLVASDDPAGVREAFLASSEVDRTIGSGDTKTSVVTRDGVQVDLRVVPPASFGAALVYFTGSKAHNIRLRQRALERGWTLNEYALAVQRDDPGTDLEVVAQRTEAEIYEALELAFVPPELREDDGEVERASGDGFDALPTLGDLEGDLHDHTDLSGDGRDPLETLVAAAVDRGLSYLAITDHAEDLAMNGVSREGMLAQRAQLRELEQSRGDIRLLHGAELNIDAAGGVDYDADFLAGFDWLVASVHSYFARSVEEQTQRIVTAMRNPAVSAIGHLTGRKLGSRPGIELDVDAVLDAAVETGTAIEINAALSRLDAPVEVIREGARRGVTFVISTDAHAAGELARARFGIAQARRAGLGRASIANTWAWARFGSWLDERRV
ncbi:MAG: DNA polymerase/3'-5' exonuclease PolX [Nitriliruptoraceae bacterium]|nr:DNA polymerase/3'-5' exonuclease PolX [Nitriliruptoraceae bacterium]